MHRAPRYRRHGWRKWLAAVAVAAAAGLAYVNWPLWKSFSPQDLIINSELKEKSLALPVREITAPVSKLKAYLLEDKTNPIVSLSFIFKNAGYASDNEYEQGIAQMAAALLTEGAGQYSGQKLKEELESRAINVSFAAQKDDFVGSMLTTSANLGKAAEFLRLMLEAPRFDEADMVRVRAQMTEALRRQSENPSRVLELKFAEEMYGKHPYSRNPLGRAEDINKITATDLRKFAMDNFSRNNLIIGIAGDVSASDAENLVDKIFAGLPQSGQMNFVRNAEIKFDGRTKKISKNSGQNMFMGAMRGVGRNDEDFYPLYVANYIWGGAGLTSRLSQQIREKEALTYGIYSYLGVDDKSPLLVVAFASTADKFVKAEKLLAEETERMQRKGVSTEELLAAKNYLTASYNLRFASIENISEILTAMQKYNLGLDFLQKRNDYVSNVRLEQVNAVAKKYFDKDYMVKIELGQF